MVPAAGDLGMLAGLGWPVTGPVRPAALTAGPSFVALFQALQRRIPLGTAIALALGSLLGLLVWLLLPQKTEVNAYLLVRRQQPVVLTRTAEAAVYRDYGEFEISKQTVASMLTNPFVLNAALNSPAISNLGIVKAEPDAMKWLIQSIKVPPSESEVLQVALSATNAQEGADLLNSVVEAFMREWVDKQRKEKNDRLSQLEAERARLQKDIAANSEVITGMVKQLGTNNPETAAVRQQTLLAQWTQLQAERRAVRQEAMRMEMQVTALRVQVDNYQEMPIPELAVDQAMNADPSIRDQMAVLSETEAALQHLMAVLPDSKQEDTRIALLRLKRDNIKEEIDARKAELRPQVAASLQTQGGMGTRQMMEIQLKQAEESRKLLTDQLKTLDAQVEGMDAQVAAIGLHSNDLNRYLMDAESLKSTFNDVDEEMRTLKIELAAPPRVTFIQRASPPPTSDLKFRLLLIGFSSLLGIAAGATGVAFWEFQTRRVGSNAEISDGLGMRVVGQLPSLQAGMLRRGKKNKEQQLRGMLAESVNSVRTALLCGTGENPTRVVMVTSAAAGEGKTTLASQLAASIARAGRRTLLVDGDLRNPTCHRLLDVPLEPGLCDVLRGEVELQDAVRPTRANGLWTMPAGRCDREGVEALARNVLREVFDQLRTEFDFVIIDAGPVLPIADSLLLGQHVDATLLTVLLNVSQLPKVYDAYERLQSVGIPVMGAVVSGGATGLHDRPQALPSASSAA